VRSQKIFIKVTKFIWTSKILDASNRPILKLKTSKNPDIADKVKLQLKPTTKNNSKSKHWNKTETKMKYSNQG
jgi:hypothetical protein